ncbi:MAG TPA: hypothetical protein DEA66_04850 [Flavobacteriales bacterium]|nr:hypothetical protein [Flavobacteriales bacterium]
MRRSFYPTKYASLREALSPRFEKASSWVREHRRPLSWVTTLVAVSGLTWTLSTHGGWASLTEAKLTRASCLVMAVLLWPLNLGLEAWKWRKLSSDALGHATSRSWAVVWKEVLVGQTWALLGPFRLADGAGRLATVDDSRLKSAAGAKAFALGAASQGWATWFFAVPALALAGFGLYAGILGLLIALVARWVPMSFHGSVAACSLLRYVTFSTQYLLMLSAWNVLDPAHWISFGCPRIAAVWCAVGSIPWPAELGVREAMAAWVFDENLPGVVAATFALWLVNRVGSAALGLIWVGQAGRTMKIF